MEDRRCLAEKSRLGGQFFCIDALTAMQRKRRVKGGILCVKTKKPERLYHSHEQAICWGPILFMTVISGSRITLKMSSALALIIFKWISTEPEFLL
jgi:hypothetical protein